MNALGPNRERDPNRLPENSGLQDQQDSARDPSTAFGRAVRRDADLDGAGAMCILTADVRGALLILTAALI